MRAFEVVATIMLFNIVFNGIRYYTQFTYKNQIDLNEIFENSNRSSRFKKDSIYMYTQV